MSEFRLVAGRIHDAADYRDLFGQANSSRIKSDFRAMAREVHPDRVPSANSAEATLVTDKLNKFYSEACRALKNGTYAPAQLVFESATQRHEALGDLGRFFDMTKGYAARSILNGTVTDSFVKVAQVPQDNELLVQEASALTVLASTNDEHRMYFPTLVDSFNVADGRKRLKANVVARLDGFVNLEEVAQRYPAGIHPLDMGWIWRRVLWALGGVHEVGLLHGALVPSHIMIHPALHGVVLVDWCYSVQKTGDRYPGLSAIVGAKRSWYPERVLKREAPTEALDLGLAARSMMFVTDETVLPDAMRRYFAKLTAGDSTASAYGLLAQFDMLLEHLGAPYYPRTYRPLNW